MFEFSVLRYRDGNSAALQYLLWIDAVGKAPIQKCGQFFLCNDFIVQDKIWR